MKKTSRLIALIAAIVIAFSLLPVTGGAGSVNRPLTKSEREAKLVKLADFAEQVAAITTVYDKDIEQKKGGGEFALARLIVKSSKKLSDENAVASASGYNDWYVFQYASPEEAQAALKRFNSMSCVEWAEPDEIMSVLATPGSSSFKSWGFGASHINMYEYNQWLYGLYGNSIANMPEIIVAVIDTGADQSHSFLSGRLVPGWNFVNNTDNPQDGHSHGTHVCGTVVDGTFANVKVMPIKVLSDSGSGSTLDVGLGMEYGSLHGAQVENMSLGGGCDGGEEHHFMAEIVDAAFDNGTTIVVAAGNDSQDAANCCPANIQRLCTVASIGTGHALSSFSNYGAIVDVCAPGESISSSVPGGGFETKSGTSMASPHVAAVAAQIKTANPDMSADEVVAAMKATAQNINLSNAGTGMAHLAADLFGLDPAVNAEGFHYHFASSGNYAWTVDGASVVSGNAGVNSSTSTMKTELTLGPDQTVTFDYKVSSQQGHDYLRVKANGTTVFETSGEQDWQTQTVTIPSSGSVTLSFEFSKDSSGASGSDKAWIRNFSVGRSLSSAANLTGGTTAFVSTGTYPWIVNEEENAAMSSNAGADNSSSVMTASVTLKKGMIVTFKYKVSSAAGDNFLFKFNGNTVLTSGETDGFTDFEYTVPSTGTHTLTFEYKKNASGSSGEDCAMIKYFCYYHTFDSAINGGDVFLPFNNDAEYPWYAMFDYATSSNWSMGDTESYFTLQLPMHPGETLSFRYRTSSCSGYDYFRFYVDDTQKTQTSGETNWATYTFTATQEKTYTFKWSYEKYYYDLSSWFGVEDAAYVDDVVYSGTLAGLLGDINNDGVVDAEDALLALRYSMQIIDDTGLVLANGDMNGDSIVDATDALLILRLVMGME